MKRTNPLTMLTAWLALILAPNEGVVAAATTGNIAAGRQAGSISGQISNAATRAFLEGATVRVSGTDRVALTDREGRFSLASLPEGSVTLEISYTGLNAQRIPVIVSAGEKVALDAALTSDVLSLIHI